MQSSTMRVFILLVLAAWLTGCGGSEEEARTSESARNTADEPADPAPVEKEDVEPLTVSMDAGVTLRDDLRLGVTGTTNLPADSRLLVIIEREASGARWHERTRVNNGQFRAGPMGFGSGVPDGDYRVRVQLSEASIQPPGVRQRIGDKGEALKGQLVRQAPHGLGHIAVYTRAFSVGDEIRHRNERRDEVRYPQG
ncbi:hypothetical protein [Vreelandella jeotgali]|uniref:hypothetical protein n=1 Tax=Vreelandella jeotgali TaxID=553386 RepID=UPI00034739D0|nr:hypothetical protein [Halomonas jeotgali]